MAQARNIKEVFDLLIKTYKEDPAISTWCAANFNEQPETQAGVDDDDLPEMTGKLAIRIIPGSRSRTRGMSKRSHGLVIRAIIHHTEIRTLVPAEPDTNWTTLEAMELIDSFINKIEEATIKAIQNNSIAITPLDGAPDQIIYPYARAELAYTIEIPSDL